MQPSGPVSGDDGRPRTWPVLLVVATALVGALALLVYVLWPDGDGDDDVATDRTEQQDDGDGTTTTGEPQVTPASTTTVTTVQPAAPTDLLGGGFPVAYADLLAAAGDPQQVLSISVYDTYAFLAYRDPTDPSVIDQREWRDGEVGDAEPNPGTDRVDADAEARLFAPGEIDPTLLAQLIADAPLHYDIPVAVSHVIVDRFLPFDDRVLIRVYTVPTDGRSGGGYVSYDTAGALVRVCC